MPVFAFVFKRISLKDIIHPVPCLCPILFQGWSAFCLVPFVLTQMTVLGKSAALRLSCTFAGPGQECACLAFVQDSLDTTDTGAGSGGGPGGQGARLGTGSAPRPAGLCHHLPQG